MTYCNQEWLSSYTYLGIRARLIAEDALHPGHRRARAGPMRGSLGRNHQRSKPRRLCAGVS